MVMENAPETLRGELTRWLLETKADVFVGKVNGLVRNLLWDKVCEQQMEGGALLIFNAANEQGFDIKMHGNPRRAVIDLDGVNLINIQQ